MLLSAVCIIYVTSLAAAGDTTSTPNADTKHERDSITMKGNISLNRRDLPQAGQENFRIADALNEHINHTDEPYSLNPHSKNHSDHNHNHNPLDFLFSSATNSFALITERSHLEDMSIAYAVQKGFVAQNEYCNIYCNGSRRSRGHDDCSAYVSCSECFCDKACKQYRDCCPSSGNSTVPDIAGTGAHMCTEIMFGFERRFVKVIRSCSSASDTRGVHECPDCGGEARLNSEGGTRYLAECSRCGHGSSLALSLDSKAVYCNADCARCNGDTRLVSLPPTTCMDTGETVYVWNHKDDKKQLISPVRQCVQGTAQFVTQRIDTCMDTMTSGDARGVEMAALCQLYSYPVRFGNVSYRNMFCALCNGERLWRVTCLYVNVDFIIFTDPGITMLTSLKPLRIHINESLGPTGCFDDQWYDSVMDICRNIMCFYGRIRVPGQLYCEDPTVANSSLLLYTLHPSFTVFTNATHAPCIRDWSLVRDAIISHLAQTLQNLNVTTYTIRVSHFTVKKGTFTAFVEFIVRKSEYQTDFELKIIEFFIHSRLFLEIRRNSAIRFRTHLTKFSIEGKTLVSFTNGSCCYETWDNSSLESMYFKDIHHVISRKNLSIIKAFDPMMPFAHVLLNNTEYKDMDGSIILTNTNTTLLDWQTENRIDGLYVPIVYLKQAYKSAGLFTEPLRLVKMAWRSDPVQSILSRCCLVVSIVSLIFLLVTYGTFPQLRSLPGLNNMWLATWLLLAQLLLLTVPGLTEVNGCHVLGMVLHYAWLCVISWSCVCSVHMFHVFVTQLDQLHAPHRKSWYIKRYLTLAHVFPAVIVGLVVGCTTILTEGHETGYGVRVCYLNTVLLRGVAFVLPLAVSVAWNVVLLLKTACALSKAKRAQSLVGQSEPSYLRIYAKLSSLTGFCWFFAFMAELPGCEWMVYASVVLNGLQGFYLAVSYAGNQRVLTMWRVKVFGKKGTEPKTRTSDSTGRPAESTQSSGN